MTAAPDPKRDDAALLERQLREALADARAARSPAFEVALLSGLRERLPGPSAVLTEVDAWLQTSGAEQLAAELPRINIDLRAEPLLQPSDEEPDDERVDALLAFDELCAGLTFCGAGQRCETLAQLLTRSIRAQPSAWAALSDFASRVLHRAPPIAGDPAGNVWRAIEAAESLNTADDAGAYPTTPLVQFEREPMRLAASTGAPKTQNLSLAATIKVVLIESSEGAELLIEIQGEASSVSVLRDGLPVPLDLLRIGTWACPAETGLYVLTINGQTYPLRIN